MFLIIKAESMFEIDVLTQTNALFLKLFLRQVTLLKLSLLSS